MNFVWWTKKAVEHGCWLNGMKGYANNYLINMGVSVAAEFPADVTFAMDPNFPDDTLTPDFLNNINGVNLISQRLRQFLESKNVPQLEYLPVTILDHRGKVVKPPYCIVNALAMVPALKVDESGAEFAGSNKRRIVALEKFVVDEAVLATAPPIFRIQQIPKYIFMDRVLATEIRSQFQGNRWIDPNAIADKTGLPGSQNMTVAADAKF